MKTLVYSSNIMCQACVDKVEPVLNNFPSLAQWSINLKAKERLLSLEVQAGFEAQELTEKLKSVGYKLKLQD